MPSCKCSIGENGCGHILLGITLAVRKEVTGDKGGKEEKRGKRWGRCIRQVAIQVEARINILGSLSPLKKSFLSTWRRDAIASRFAPFKSVNSYSTFLKIQYITRFNVFSSGIQISQKLKKI